MGGKEIKQLSHKGFVYLLDEGGVLTRWDVQSDVHFETSVKENVTEIKK